MPLDLITIKFFFCPFIVRFKSFVLLSKYCKTEEKNFINRWCLKLNILFRIFYVRKKKKKNEFRKVETSNRILIDNTLEIDWKLCTFNTNSFMEFLCSFSSSRFSFFLFFFFLIELFVFV